MFRCCEHCDHYSDVTSHRTPCKNDRKEPCESGGDMLLCTEDDFYEELNKL